MKKIWVIVAAVLVTLLAIFGTNYVRLQQPLEALIKADPRNEGIAIRSYYRHYVSPSVIVFDLRQLGDESRHADVMRTLFQFAQEMKERDYDRVLLAWKGEPKFELKGSYFKQLGEEFAYQNPLFTLRTFQENVYKLDGEPAFGTWRGGLLGVASRQLEDMNELQRQWYLNDLLAVAK